MSTPPLSSLDYIILHHIIYTYIISHHITSHLWWWLLSPSLLPTPTPYLYPLYTTTHLATEGLGGQLHRRDGGKRGHSRRERGESGLCRIRVEELSFAGKYEGGGGGAGRRRGRGQPRRHHRRRTGGDRFQGQHGQLQHVHT